MICRVGGFFLLSKRPKIDGVMPGGKISMPTPVQNQRKKPRKK